MDTLGAKQVARRIGTTAKIFRKFLRSPASPYESVGQGGRYEFPVSALPELKKAFIQWQTSKRVQSDYTSRSDDDSDL